MADPTPARLRLRALPAALREANAFHQRLWASFEWRFDRPFARLLDGTFAINLARIGSIPLHSAVCGRLVLPTFPRQLEVSR